MSKRDGVGKREKKVRSMTRVNLKGKKYPDFTSVSRKIFGRKKVRVTGTEVVSSARGNY